MIDEVSENRSVIKSIFTMIVRWKCPSEEARLKELATVAKSLKMEMFTVWFRLIEIEDFRFDDHSLMGDMSPLCAALIYGIYLPNCDKNTNYTPPYVNTSLSM